MGGCSRETSAHNQIKMEIARVVGSLPKEKRLGRYFGNRMLLTNFQASLSTEPDGMFFYHDTLASGRVVMRQRNQAVEIQGSPDLVMEVVSKTSTKKDSVAEAILSGWHQRILAGERAQAGGVVRFFPGRAEEIPGRNAPKRLAAFNRARSVGHSA